MRIAFVMVLWGLTVLGPTTARAVEIFSPPMFAPANIWTRCPIANVGTKPMKDTIIETIRENGSVAGRGGPFLLEPGKTGFNASLSPIDEIRRCRWSIQGSKRKVRAGICVDLFGCLPAE